LTQEEEMGYKNVIGFGNDMKTKAYVMVRLPFRLKKEGASFVSWCPALDVSSAGDSAKEAEKNLVEALRLFIMSCYERGTLDRIFKECGFVPEKANASLDRKSSSKKEIWVPLPFVVDQNSARCRA
jgi:predicted RNase H-like HicB family nuclease